jgi:hypothetical protein
MTCWTDMSTARPQLYTYTHTNTHTHTHIIIMKVGLKNDGRAAHADCLTARLVA